MSVNEIQLANRFIKLDPDSRRNFLNKLQLHELDFLELPIVEARHLYADTIPLSYAQRSLWLTWQLNPQSSAYNMSGILKIKGKLDKQALQQGINALVARHETLRTLFVLTEANEPIQQIKQDVNISLAEHDLTAVQQTDIKAIDLSNEFASQAFQLDQEPPFRASLLCLPDDIYHLLVSIHHIAADGWSLKIFIDELIALYTQAVTGTSAALAELPIQFADFSIWQRSWLDAGEMDKQLDYWCQHLGHEYTELNLPFDHSRAANTSMPAAGHSFLLTDNVATALKTLATQQQSSLYMVMLSLLKLTLNRLTGETDLRIGSPIANRTRAETHGLIGYLTNVQVLRTQLDVTAGFTELLTQVRATVLGGQSNPDVPFDMLVETLKPERKVGVHPFFQVKCTQKTHDDNSGKYQFSGLTMQIEGLGVEEAHFDLSFDFTDKGSEIAAAFNYNSALFEPETIARFADLFVFFAEQVLATPKKSLALLTVDHYQSEKQGAALEFSDDTVLDLWHKSVATKAEQIVVQDQHTHLTFKALDERANQLASQLQQQGISRGDCVAVVAERSCEFVLAILAILKSGGMYLPLDPQQPRERLLYQLKDSQSAVMLTAVTFDELADVPQIKLDVNEVLYEHVDFIVKPIHPDQPAYMIYTSGTTGQPKGVVVTHGALNNYTQSVLAELALPEVVKTMAMVSTVAADLGNTTLFSALCSGRTLHLISADVVFDPDAFAQYMTTHYIDVLKIVPSHLQGLLSAAEPENVLPKQLLIVGGEATSQSLLTQINQLAPELEVLNHYGPTESTVGVLTNKLMSSGKIVDFISLGLPIANTKVCVLGAELQAVPTGVVGELYIGGVSLAQGYLAITGQTAERFIADPEGSGARLYRTGDKVKQLSDGTFEFIGRVDEQVKIRGYRVELNEVKQHLLNIEDISDAAVIVKEQEGRAQLHAYLVPTKKKQLDTENIRQLLSVQLPDYMVPTRLTELAALPLNANGKLDKKALLAQIKSNHLVQVDSQQVQGPQETVLAKIWQELLKVEQIGRHDNFFELGGDSILALQVVARARKKGLKFTPKALMAKQTIAALVAVIKMPINSTDDNTEALLTTIWRDVLKVENVANHDNFFELGGDSILALQVVARARKQGLKFSPKALMAKQTISELAKVTTQKGKKSTEPVTQVLSQSPFALLPTQQWFFEQEFKEAEHWNQSVMLQAPQGCDFALVKEAAQLLIQRHPALAMCFEKIYGQWQQYYNTANADVAFALIDLTNAENKSQAIKTSADQIQASLSFKQPFKIIGFDLGQGGSSQLLLTGHHLVVDGVSWRIILEDLQSIYLTLSKGEKLTLEQDAGFKTWSEQLSQQTKTGAFTQELDYWMDVVSESQANLPGNSQGDNTLASCQSLSVELDSGQTQQLLSCVPKAYRTQINDVLLAALTPVLCHWSGRDDVLVELEGHGRETLFDDLDISNAVGWFTSLYPVRLTTNEDIASLLKGVKETLRKVPNHGLGYGALRYLTTEGKVLSQSSYPQVTFNYLGQFDQVINKENDWRLSDEAKGVERALTSERRTWLDFNVLMFEGKLKISLNYSEEIHTQVEAQGLLDSFLAQLKSLIIHCTSGDMGITPSDFPLVNIAQSELDQLALPLQMLSDLYPLSPMQSGMYFHSIYDETGTSYVNQLALDISELDSERFKSAWQAVLNRHDILRTGFVTHDKQSLQWVAKTAELPCIEFDWRDEQKVAVKLQELAASQLAEGFCLDTPPLMKIALVRVADDTWHFIWTRHHLLLDGWSTSLLLAEVLRHYTGQALPAVSSHYRDYIHWLSSCDMKETEAFWSEQLTRLVSPTFLVNSFAKTGAKAKTSEGYGKVRLTLDVTDTAQLSDFSKKNHITMNTLVQGGWSLLLSRYASQTTIAFGAIVAGRPSEIEGIEQKIGLFMNILPVIVNVSPEQVIGDWLRELQSQNFTAREYEYTALTDIHRWAGHGSHGIFDSIIVFENFPINETLNVNSPGGLVFGDIDIKEESNYPLMLVVTGSDTLVLEFNYDNAFYDEQSIERLSQHFEQVLTQFIEGKSQSLGEIAFVSDSEVKQLEQWGVNETRYDNTQPVHQLIEQQVELTHNATALVFEEQKITYTELNQRANQLAHYLIAQGIKPEDKVGIAVERSVEMVVSLLAVLKAGAAYVPLDPDYPNERLAYIMQDSDIKILLSQSELLKNLPELSTGSALCLDQLILSDEAVINPDIKLHGDNLAYLIYTSGSTGKPKAVAISHAGFAEHVVISTAFSSLTPADRMLQFSTINFDGFIEQMFPPLIVGASLVLRGPDLWDAETFYQQLINKNITIADLPTAYWFMLIQYFAQQGITNYGQLREIHIGGEAMPPKGIKVWLEANLDNVTLLNTYGPTEAIVVASISDCSHRIIGGKQLSQQVLIGTPVPGRALHVLDRDLNVVQLDMEGELYIGGELLARGYKGRAGLTSTCFIADPFGNSGGRLYRTGDLVRWNKEGELEYLGRIDHQVKIRGFRIELGEIEAELLKNTNVTEAVAVVNKDQSCARLVAYVSANADTNLDVNELKSVLGQSLPDYMVPSVIVLLDALPLNPNGKIDRKVLPEPEFIGNNEYQAPEGEIENQLAKIWSEVLGVAQVGRHDNFFELGGDSLLSLKVISKLSSLNVDALNFKLRDLMQQPTIAGLLGHDNKKSPLLLMNTQQEGKPILFCFHAGMGTLFDYQPLANQLQGQRTLYGVPCRTLADPSYKDVLLEQMALDYCQMVREKQAHGPYALFGWSLGATLAAMVAALLEAAGQQVEFLGLVDSFIPDIKGLSLDAWQTDFTDYLSVVLPQISTVQVNQVLDNVYPSHKQALLPDAVLLEATIADLLADLATQSTIQSINKSINESVSDEQDAGYAALGSEGLMETFMMARHLTELSCQSITLPKLKVTPHYWWVADRPESDKKQLLALFEQEISQDFVLDTDHFSIIRDQRLITEVDNLLTTEHNKSLKESKTLV
jgi:amino acid adenylation domain-containing protein/non-ribosomal peptide synthase protein (TIGR01720 family)